MTPEEAIKILEKKKEYSERIIDNFLSHSRGEIKDANKTIEMCDMAISVLKEIQQYREIGTVEECRKAMSRCREREKLAKCEECLFFEERKLGKNGAISGICRIKPQNGRRYGKSRACKFFEKDYENSEVMEDE